MDPEKDEKKERREESPSCGCQDSQGTGKSHLIRVVRTLIFAVVMLMAIGVSAWSLLKNNTTEGMAQREKGFKGNKTLCEPGSCRPEPRR